MAEKSFPLENTVYNAEDAALWFATRTSGVYANDELAVKATGGMYVAVEIGMAWLAYKRFAGVAYANTEEMKLKIIEVDQQKKRVVASRKAVVAEEAAAKKKEVWDKLEFQAVVLVYPVKLFLQTLKQSERRFVHKSQHLVFCRHDMGDIIVCTRQTRFMNRFVLENPTGSVSMRDDTL